MLFCCGQDKSYNFLLTLEKVPLVRQIIRKTIFISDNFAIIIKQRLCKVYEEHENKNLVDYSIVFLRGSY